MTIIRDVESLKALYGATSPIAAKKEVGTLDDYCRRFIELSPFVVIATLGEDGLLDCSPRGDAPGFVAVEDEKTVLIPDRRGNNRLDTLCNLIANPEISLLFLLPGVDETFRINGIGEIDTDTALCERFTVKGKAPKSIIRVRMQTAYMQCAKALMRSRLWSGDYMIKRRDFPAMGEIMKAHAQHDGPAETREEMLKRYQDIMY